VNRLDLGGVGGGNALVATQLIIIALEPGVEAGEGWVLKADEVGGGFEGERAELTSGSRGDGFVAGLPAVIEENDGGIHGFSLDGGAATRAAGVVEHAIGGIAGLGVMAGVTNVGASGIGVVNNSGVAKLIGKRVASN